MPLTIKKHPSFKTTEKERATTSSVLVFNEHKDLTLADQALSLVSDADELKKFVREHGCIHCLPRHLRRKFSNKADLFIFRDGTSLLSDPKSKHKAFSKNEEETLDFLKAKPSKNEMFFKIMQLKKKRHKNDYKNVRNRGVSSFEY